jgi:hypothetical protein
MRRTDLLLNFHYAIEPDLLGRFRRTRSSTSTPASSSSG